MAVTNSLIEEKLKTAEEVAALLPQHVTLGCSGFTPAGYPKLIPVAFAKRIEEEKQKGKDFSINLYAGASTGEELDGALARTGALKLRIPYQSNSHLRNLINQGETDFIDMHLSHVVKYIEHGILPKIDVAIVEAIDVTVDGKIYLSTSSGMSATYIRNAESIYVELTDTHPLELKGYHDIYLPNHHDKGLPINILTPGDRIGLPFIQVSPDKIKGIVRSSKPDAATVFKTPDEDCQNIAAHVLSFIQHEIKMGRIPKEYLPFQNGVGNIANAVLASMAKDPNFHSIQMYTEVVQDSVFDLIDAGKLEIASTSALTFSEAGLKRFHENIVEWKSKFVIRPQEISNHPEVIRRMGLIAMNTAIEVDIYGNVNSTHVMGTSMMNGIGGSGDFTRNSHLCIFMTPSLAKDGNISAVVPMVSHTDHNEHSTMVFVTEQGLADLRGCPPKKRAELIINNCAHPIYRDKLREYYENALRVSKGKHTPHDLERALSWHVQFLKTGSMK
ncbi:succinate CoA transferase [Leptospira meyeri]|uniref:succinate CoA transferase n=1 Tax=Leptospira meyeri TaxID=29508 RepID=UPI0002BE1254|nr:succinate CoA transferase [Leptospira meyeri]PKA22498.1 acetyl-CoA hydrolase [Leptospira sp. mixed culture ATI2-C-A1]EMJ89715.1 succinate CoA transferase [Leptospira meyeri serovar Semaranga str. Veldrot Semarang 173]MCW7489237.1 succinate CoA transferase [Leptospira meyeri]PJZ82360.1 acetyl-CoA hydrolase [Leptospira meyeri]PJZ98665.1 acetyl-CoA hydrolase [Leptospira meyeri]